MRRRRRFAGPWSAIAALALSFGCATREETTRLGYVIAPSAPIVPEDGGGALDDAAPGSRSQAMVVATRPLPPEPMAPRDARGCKRETKCRDEDEEAPRVPFPAPFERCTEAYSADKGATAARLSVSETRLARVTDPTKCCYVEFTCRALAPGLSRP